MATQQQAASSSDTSKVKQKLQQHLDKAKSRLEQAKRNRTKNDPAARI